MDILSQTMYSNMKEEIGPSPENPQHSQDVVMPGFRFHPTEEELVEFYLRRKVEGKPFNIELITVVDLYRYDPWELPAFAAIGEKEWFFYVPRDRKYRNGDRPNRVTASGYWKATGADRMIRNESSRSIIGLKKTLVFYTGKAPKGKRTAWIMNEYRLPQNETEKIPRNELSLCRVYKKSGIELERSQARRTQERSETENAGSTECIEKQQMECSSSSQSEMKGAKTKPAFAVEETSSDSKRYRFGLATAPDRLLENMQGGVAEGGEGALMACSSTTSSIGCWTHNNVMQLSLASSSHIYCHPTSLPLAFEEHHKNMEMNGPSVSTFDELQHLQFSATATPPAEKLWEWDPSKGNGSSR